MHYKISDLLNPQKALGLDFFTLKRKVLAKI